MIGVYCRVSTDKQLDNYSIPIQKEKGIKFANSHNLPYELFVESGSGGNYLRPEFQRLLESISNKKIDKVWVINRDRLTRGDLDDVVKLRNFFGEHGVELYINDSLLNLESPEALFSDNILASMAKYFRDNIKRHVKRSRDRAKDLGVLHVNCMYGYKKGINPETGKTKWVIDEVERTGVEYIFTNYRNGVSLNNIATGLNKLGLKPKLSDSWSPTKIVKVMKNTEYFGLSYNTQGELIDHKLLPPIFDKSEYKNYGSEKGRRKQKAEKFRFSEHLCSGIVRCPVCKTGWYLKWDKEVTERNPYGYQYYYHIDQHGDCENKPKFVYIKTFESFFILSFAILFFQVDEITSFLEERTKELFEGVSDIDTLVKNAKKEVEVIDKKLDRILDMLIDPENDSIQDKLNIQKSALISEKLSKGELIESFYQTHSDQLDELEVLANEFSLNTVDEFKLGNNAVRRRVLKTLIQEAVSLGDKLTITFKNKKRFQFTHQSNKGSKKGQLKSNFECLVSFRGVDQYRLVYNCFTYEVITLDVIGKAKPVDREDQRFINDYENRLKKNLPTYLKDFIATYQSPE